MLKDEPSNNPLWKACYKFHNVGHSPTLTEVSLIKLAAVADSLFGLNRGWEGMREHERRRNGMRVRDESREGGCLWAQRGGGSWKATEDEGIRFKMKGWIKVQAGTHTHTNSLSLSQKTSELRKLNWDKTATTGCIWQCACVTNHPVETNVKRKNSNLVS